MPRPALLCPASPAVAGQDSAAERRCRDESCCLFLTGELAHLRRGYYAPEVRAAALLFQASIESEQDLPASQAGGTAANLYAGKSTPSAEPAATSLESRNLASGGPNVA